MGHFTRQVWARAFCQPQGGHARTEMQLSATCDSLAGSRHGVGQEQLLEDQGHAHTTAPWGTALHGCRVSWLWQQHYVSKYAFQILGIALND